MAVLDRLGLEQPDVVLGRVLEPRRELRLEASLTGRALARLTGLHYTKISRAENGRQSVTDAEIRACYPDA